MDTNLTTQRESFPKLDLIAAKAAMDRLEVAVCVFEARKRMIGQAFIVDVHQNSILLNYVFTEEYSNYGESQIELTTINSSTIMDRNRRVFECPRCESKRWSLYYKNVWLCRDCLNLNYRSELVDKEVKLWEERDSLRQQLSRGRPKGMHNRTYMELRQRLFALDNRLSGRTQKFASSSQDMIVQSRWVSGSEVDLWSSRYSVREGDFVLCSSLT